ncbi:hypothetical protein GH714_014989 [Hevea brasiliensis]|uniref:Carboxypeptidase n=1 Tax=Hevea brasiliensis TaxID=3981 RepID=A0A6A6LI25_HEVBR|nr:hypothetical protein GH714_014989 [Hevea brasiliensis]
MTRALNLFPKHSINMPTHVDSLVTAPQIVEKPLKLHLLGDPEISVQDLGHHAGYYKLPHAKDASISTSVLVLVPCQLYIANAPYYLQVVLLFFESRNSKDDPVVIWLTGGPGCSSELALFYENGPFHLSKNKSLIWNDYGWDKASNLIYVDQPIGTGFSYTTDANDIRHDENGVSNDLYDFLQAFFKEHPQFVKNDFYITGESYAGHYIPAFAARVHQGNKNKEGIQINLKGFAIGNGLTDPGIQYKAYTDYALDKKLIQKYDYDRINKLVPECEQAIKACGTDGESACDTAYVNCNNIFSEILDVVGVGNLDFVSCSSEVYDAMVLDWMRNLEVGIPAVLEDGIRVLIYAGEEDLICNWLGNSRWVHAMEWSGQQDFGAAPTVPFVVEGAEAGQMKSHGPLTFLKVREAGHMVPMDQPKAALQMLKSWMQGKLAVTRTKERISPK